MPALHPTAAQIDAKSQLPLGIGAWEDVWPEAPVLGRSSQRAWGAWPEAAFSLCRQSLSRPGQRWLNLAPVCPSPPGAVEGPLHLGPRRRRPGLAGFSLNLLCVLGA